MIDRSRRGFLADVGRGMLVASVGPAVAVDMGLSSARADETADNRLTFGEMEPLVSLMQETPPEKLMPLLVQRLDQGASLRTLVAAGALANARTFAGEDYIGFHTFMALSPAYEMSRELPEALRPLPVLKVLYRNASRMQAQGGCKHEHLHPVEPAALPPGRNGGELLQELVRKGDGTGAERAFAAMVQGPVGEAYQHLQYEIQDEINVHRVVLSWRAWTMLDIAGQQYADTLLRQSVRFCLDEERRLTDKQGHRRGTNIRDQLPKLIDQYKLLSHPLGTRRAEDGWIEQFSNTIYAASPTRAADAAAAALAEGISPESIGEALSLAANSLVLHDVGRRQAQPDKPLGSVHGDSVGVHASDAANAWRNIARVSNQRNTAASLIVGAFHTAGQSGGLKPQAYPLPEQLSEVTVSDPAALVDQLSDAIRQKDQFRATAVAARYGQLGGQPRPIFDLLLGFATSEDGALHAEKYYRTVSEEFGQMRPAFRWRQLVALARVTASEYGKPAPGYAQAKGLLKIS
ncbi:MAG TPA: hypothetical protein VIK18_05795 [Pirellulales bacterium]